MIKYKQIILVLTALTLGVTSFTAGAKAEPTVYQNGDRQIYIFHPKDQENNQSSNRTRYNGPNVDYYRGPARIHYNGPNVDYYRGPARTHYNGPNVDYYRGPARTRYNGPNVNYHRDPRGSVVKGPHRTYIKPSR